MSTHGNIFNENWVISNSVTLAFQLHAKASVTQVLPDAKCDFPKSNSFCFGFFTLMRVSNTPYLWASGKERRVVIQTQEKPTRGGDWSQVKNVASWVKIVNWGKWSEAANYHSLQDCFTFYFYFSCRDIKMSILQKKITSMHSTARESVSMC